MIQIIVGGNLMKYHDGIREKKINKIDEA